MRAESADQDTTFALADQCGKAADKLYRFIARRHLRPDGSLIGPAPGTRLNLRIGRFIKSYLSLVSSRDDRYYVQGQAYWIAANLHLHRLTGDQCFLDAAIRCAEVVLSRQTDSGHWVLDNPEWKGRITTVEACFGGLALLDAYSASGHDPFLNGARRAHSHLVTNCGFLQYDDESLCIRYFSNHPSAFVPNNATLAIWFFAELSAATGDRAYLQYCPEQVSFLAKCQLESGELPYALGFRTEPIEDRPHYLCYQYNSFELMDLLHYFRLTSDERILPVARKLAGYLAGGLAPRGNARYNCFKACPVVNYYTAAVSAALLTAHRAGLGCYEDAIRRGYGELVARQRPDGGFEFSRGDYRVLSDKRSYPANQAMILRHLLLVTPNES